MRVVFVIGVIALSASAMGQTVFDVTLDGAQVPVASPYTGSGTVTLNQAQNQMTISITHDIPAVDVQDGHIHQGAVGVNGGIIFPFSGGGVSPINEVIAISPGQVTTLFAEGYYVNIHTDDFPSGEIRGQIVAQPAQLPMNLSVASSWKLLVLAGSLIAAAGFFVANRKLSVARITR